jgi:hypothetical protein
MVEIEEKRNSSSKVIIDIIDLKMLQVIFNFNERISVGELYKLVNISAKGGTLHLKRLKSLLQIKRSEKNHRIKLVDFNGTLSYDFVYLLLNIFGGVGEDGYK